jgi:hypothetical protein
VHTTGTATDWQTPEQLRQLRRRAMKRLLIFPWAIFSLSVHLAGASFTFTTINFPGAAFTDPEGII